MYFSAAAFSEEQPQQHKPCFKDTASVPSTRASGVASSSKDRVAALAAEY
jgi:hypothetical protein